MEEAICPCGKPIYWIRMESGNLMPLNREPDAEKGNIVVLDGVGVTLKGDLFEGMVDGPRYTSHFMDCPNAKKHRKKK